MVKYKTISKNFKTITVTGGFFVSLIQSHRGKKTNNNVKITEYFNVGKKSRIPELDDLKKAACAFMVLDHGIKLLPFLSNNNFILSILPLGRLSFPLFAWVFVQLSFSASNSLYGLWKRASVLFLFGIAVQPVYFMVFKIRWFDLNMMFTFFSALIFAFCFRIVFHCLSDGFDELKDFSRRSSKKKKICKQKDEFIPKLFFNTRIIEIILSCFVIVANSFFAKLCDYGFLGTLTLGLASFVFSEFKDYQALFIVFIGILITNVFYPEYSFLALVFILPLWKKISLKNNDFVPIVETGGNNILDKYFFHIFYFLHLYVIWIIRLEFYGQ